jgi:VCBS repeat protein
VHVPRRVRQFVVTADFNNDGIAGLLVLNEGTSQGSVSILLGNGDGTFQSPISIAMARNQSPDWPGVADLNGDGNPDQVIDVGLSTSLVMLSKGRWNIPDVVASNLRAGTVAVLLGNGDGTFESAVHYAAAVGKRSNIAALGDFNGDGFMDLAVASGGTALGSTADNTTGAVEVLLGNGDGRFETG